MHATPTPSSSSVACTVNGRPVALEVAPQTLLLDALRDQLGLKGAKRSCDIQVCGACTVLVDGAPVSACTYLAVEAGSREIQTVEGLADGETLHALQEAFIEHGAIQCGFCTSGMLLSAAALLKEDPAPTREGIVHYLRGNLCRCTGYQKIIDAIAACAKPAPSPYPLPLGGGEGLPAPSPYPLPLGGGEGFRQRGPSSQPLNPSPPLGERVG